ncbi:hypothetical protein NG271_238 [Saccharomyces cerevisiae synthetic construct]|uniref:Putative uncharacterized protein YDL016C n=2 Tax=Saccharomyces cerevisiae TaxID=4932 RepID=YD016_YEAST|nr:RecName: Full=Putative uncharacterized protein YDL016C [Saccharomyces cerevisiae S288C]WNF19795.1 hypothetical protein NG271_238 [Saccharomyces cerevisiae synthetic construct]CAA88343.1 unknown [Saccharomyces cerevisiae]CAA98575.1 unnamed protein product [Saccharomyces cerevisiae]CAY78492.1 EC1118_1D0_2201p [Saccharomyces cerevisiae EC1118]
MPPIMLNRFTLRNFYLNLSLCKYVSTFKILFPKKRKLFQTSSNLSLCYSDIRRTSLSSKSASLELTTSSSSVLSPSSKYVFSFNSLKNGVFSKSSAELRF